MRTKPDRNELLLAVHPTTYGFGWVVFEGPDTPVDWGMASARANRPKKLHARFERLLDRYAPGVLVMESFEEAAFRRSQSIKELCRWMTDHARARRMGTYHLNRNVVANCFGQMGARSRHAIAEVIAKRLPVFAHRLPPERKPWMPQDPRQSLFDAAALGLTWFALMGMT